LGFKGKWDTEDVVEEEEDFQFYESVGGCVN
jgi:hypothetical protein